MEHDVHLKVSSYECCMLCPRKCRADRHAGKRGFCGQTDEIRLARAALHFWEEPCISGKNGSGAVFFTGCTLRCIFCQNREISTGESGKAVNTEELARIFLNLKEKGAHNINLVTPTHFMPSVCDALKLSGEQGFDLPVISNTSGYERVQCIREFGNDIDIWLTDIKYADPLLAGRFSGAYDYTEYAYPALEEMVRQAGGALFDEAGLMKKGVIVRILVLPGHTKDAKAVLDKLYHCYGNDIYYSIMNQYTPPVFLRNGGMIKEYTELNRRLTKREYDKVTEYALSLGIENAFIQEGETSFDSFVPAFDLTGVLGEG